MMDLLHTLFTASPIVALFLCLAIGYALGKIRIGRFQLGGMPGTLFAAILLGQAGVAVDDNIKTMFFALFIYSLGYVSGPQFFRSLGRSTLDQVHLAVFSSVVIFVTVWCLAQVLDLDKGTAAGLLAGSTTESASVGTAGETLIHMDIDDELKDSLVANITVTYAITYLFGFTLVVFFTSAIAPRLLGIDLKDAAREYERALGGTDAELEPGQEAALRPVLVRVYRVTNPEAVGTTLGRFAEVYGDGVHIQQLARRGRQQHLSDDLTLKKWDRVTLVGRRDVIVPAGKFLGEETAQVEGLEFVGESRDVVVTQKRLIGTTLRDARKLVDPEMHRGVFATHLSRLGRDIEIRPLTRLQAGDMLTLYGPAENVEKSARAIGYTVDQGHGVDYIYLGLGIIVGILVGMITVPIAGASVALHTGGGCLISGLLFGWLRSKRPSFGSLPTPTAIHLRDFGLAMFIASVGLAAGPEAAEVLREQGIILPILAITLVSVTLLASLYYAKL
ncbi:MAG: aspartate-alanine antiporter-like transporter, partial [Gammaproteobacteria bacterium]